MSHEDMVFAKWETLIVGLKSAVRQRYGKELVVINAEGGNHNNFLTAVERVKSRNDTVVACSIPNGEIVRYPFLDVEWRIMEADDNIKITGKPDNVKKAMELLQ